MSSEQIHSRSLWESKFFRLSKKEAAESSSFREWLRSSQSDLGRYLADVTDKSPAGCFDLEDVALLERLIVRSRPKRADAVLPLHILSKIICQLNQRRQKSIPPPRYVFSLKRERNPLFPDSELAHKALRLCFSLEKKWVESLSPSRNAKIKDGDSNIPPELIVFSAALYGGILDVDVAIALYEALRTPERHFRCSSVSSRVYADLSVAAEGMADQEMRRWYPNDKLICLIARTAKTVVVDNAGQPIAERRRIVEKAVWAAVSEEFSRQQFDRAAASGPDARYLPTSLGDLLDKVRIVMHSEIPSVLAEYAARNVDCRSLLPSSIGRIYGDPAQSIVHASDPANSELEDTAEKGDPEAYGGDSPTESEPLWLPDLRKALRGEDSAEITKRLEKLGKADDPDQPRKRIVSFAIRLAKRGTTSGNPLHPSSLRCCVLTVARRIGRVIGAEDPAGYTSSALETLYLSVLGDAALDSAEPRRLQRTVAWTLREFQRYLVSECKAQPINECEVFRFSRGLLPVDARIVSIEDISKAIDCLEKKAAGTNNPARQRNFQIAQAEIVLGFFGGLRRMEGLGLRRVDFRPGPKAEVIVRTTETRHLKTANATRRIPIALMTAPFPRFLNLLNDSFLALRKDGADLQALLFDPASDDVIIPIIHDALQSVTGDGTLHYHTLRHSFCSWTLLRLMLADLPEIPDLFPHLGMTTTWVKASAEFRRSIYGNDGGDHLWYVSSFMGHAGPGISLSGYTHVFDLLLPCFLNQIADFGCCDDFEFRAAMPHSKSQAYKLLPKTDSEVPGANATTSRCFQAKIARDAFKSQFKRSTTKIAGESSTASSSWLDRTWNLLSQFGRAKLPPSFNLSNTSFEPEVAAQILNRATTLSRLQTAQGAFVHHMMNQPTASDAKKNERGCCPVRPRSPAVQASACKISMQLEEGMESDPGLVKMVLHHYAENVLPDSCRVIFRPPFDELLIAAYIGILKNLCPSGAILQYRSRDGSNGKYASAQFLESCGLPIGLTVTNITDRRRERNVPNGGLTIEPICACKTDTDELTEALCFVFLMAAIAFH